MTGNPGWNPEQYLRYEQERLRPAIDLIGRIAHVGPAEVVDLGCGAGNALPLLEARFPGAVVTGVDGSEAMLAKAAQAGFRTVESDIQSWRPDKPVDVLFSNAALHWLPSHETLFPRLLDCLAPGGVLAVQMPAMHAAPLRALQDRTARNGPWADKLRAVSSAPPILTVEQYYDLLRPRVATLDIWYTEYVHVLSGADPVVDWAKGSSLRPYLEALAPEEQAGFCEAYSRALSPAYPKRADGRVLLPFRRLFLLASL